MTAKKLRELYNSAAFIHSHIAHFYALAAPDFVMGPDAEPATRNILGIVHKVGVQTGGEVIKHRRIAQDIQIMVGGRSTHPVWTLPGGVSKGITEEQRKEIEEMGRWAIEFAQFSLKLFNDIVLGNKEYVDLILGDVYTHRTYYMGTVDENSKVNFYDGKVRVVDPNGKEFVKYVPKDYAEHIAEHVEPWTYLKFPYLKKVGWKGFVDGEDSGVYMATPLAQEQYEKFYATLGGKPVHQRLATHWARLIELLYAAERWVELVTDPEITSPNIHTKPTQIPTEGVGIVEAPRGTLTHHYWTDERGVVTKANLIVGTTNNYAPIQMSTKKAAESLIKNGNVTEGLLNMVEMAFRAYDPCFGCATHSLPGQMPLQITIHDADGNPIEVLKQYC